MAFTRNVKKKQQKQRESPVVRSRASHPSVRPKRPHHWLGGSPEGDQITLEPRHAGMMDGLPRTVALRHITHQRWRLRVRRLWAAAAGHRRLSCFSPQPAGKGSGMFLLTIVHKGATVHQSMAGHCHGRSASLSILTQCVCYLLSRDIFVFLVR